MVLCWTGGEQSQTGITSRYPASRSYGSRTERMSRLDTRGSSARVSSEAGRAAPTRLRRRVAVLYFHGGAYALGSAADSVGLAADVSRRVGARACGCREWCHIMRPADVRGSAHRVDHADERVRYWPMVTRRPFGLAVVGRGIDVADGR